MKVIAVLSLLSLAAASVLEKRACAANNCIRAVTGTRAGDATIAAHKTDCSSYQLTTVTPATVTTTVTVEADDTPAKRDFPVQIRQVTVAPSNVPAYATACAAAGEYASACSCWGITASVSTAPTPTYTVTVTADACDDL